MNEWDWGDLARLFRAHARPRRGRPSSGPPSRYGFWFVTPNAHRCLMHARQQVRLALGSLRAAWRWQRKGV